MVKHTVPMQVLVINGNNCLKQKLSDLGQRFLVSVMLGVLITSSSLAQENTAPSNILEQAAKTIGVKKCQSALARLGGIATYGSSQQDILIDWDKKQVDTNPVFSLLGADYPNGAVAVSVTAIPDDNARSCSVLAERISVAPFTCDSIAQSELVNQKVTALLPRFKVYTDPTDPDSTVSLMDSPPGCLIIRRYVKYHWVAPK